MLFNIMLLSPDFPVLGQSHKLFQETRLSPVTRHSSFSWSKNHTGTLTTASYNFDGSTPPSTFSQVTYEMLTCHLQPFIPCICGPRFVFYSQLLTVSFYVELVGEENLWKFFPERSHFLKSGFNSFLLKMLFWSSYSAASEVAACSILLHMKGRKDCSYF